ncbi:hypothetical protein OBBRIDRAFT_765594 [Obba rivulosa]|uniref:Uncharacterized protein n=1 Tax=Obba rivulosa TaxID=1052685 RepID=A0A8E2J7K4_9APHY|nr:hypothetical protein OBBRIDRAFT_765594 [Obba rivulosa]
MADIPIPDPPDLSRTEDAEGASQLPQEAPAQEPPSPGSDGATATLKAGVQGEATPSTPSPGAGSVPLKASSANGAPFGQGSTPTLSMPHPKKFTHVNINKKFLEKTSSASSPGQTPSVSATTKAGSSNQKPVLQSLPSHSRLVTAKLTATPQPSTTTGPGWSRPSSAVPSSTPTPSSATAPKPLTLPAAASGHAPPQPPPAGKVIQPQPRAASEALTSIKEGSSKPAWGNAKALAAIVNKPDLAQLDFPTAAEVAQGRAAKLMEKNQIPPAAAEQKPANTAEADAFRGLHLDPNAHHWDEEEDDDNFLDGVIEFGDGRQYNVQATDAVTASPQEAPELTADGDAESTQPVSKEERFADDFDRSWPRSRITTTLPHPPREQLAPGSASPSSSQSVHSPSEQSRVLFNERSNRLEPYSNAHRQGPAGPGGLLRRGSRSEHPISPTESRNGRDVPPHQHLQGVQLLQKTHAGHGASAESHLPSGGDRTAFPPVGDRFRDREPRREQTFPPHAMQRTPSHGAPARPRDHYNPFGLPSISPVGPGPHEGPSEERPRRTSTMGPPPLPLPVDRSRAGRQLPPHLSNARPQLPPLRTESVADNRQPPSAQLSAEPLPTPAPPRSTTQSSPAVSEKALQPPPTMAIVDIDEVRKAAMHSAAERARLRRQEEEEEREREKERARRKAAELEEKMKAQAAQAAPEQPASVQSAPVSQPTQPEKQQQVAGSQNDVTEAQVIEIIEEAVHSVQTVPKSAPAHITRQVAAADQPSPISQPVSSIRPTFARESSKPGAPRPVENRRPPGPATVSASPVVPSPSDSLSWRNSKPPAPRPPAPQPEQAPTAPPPPPPMLAEAASFPEQTDDLEVVDFSDFGKFAGVEEPATSKPQEQETETDVRPRPRRPSAADFLDDHVPAPRTATYPVKSDEGPWRRKPTASAIAAEQTLTVTTQTEVQTLPKLSVQEKPKVHIITPDAAESKPVPPIPSGSGKGPEETARMHAASSAVPQKSPLTPAYREAPMSALNDVISRIKGALDDMHTKPEPPKQLQKWLPPALRARVDLPPSTPTEVFDITVPEPPRSPKPVWNVFAVKLPRTSKPLEAISKKQFNSSQIHMRVRWDILSFEPAPTGFNRRDFNPNDALFPRPPLHKGPIRYRVVIPRVRRSGPVVNLPPRSAKPSTQADIASSWRKTAPSMAKVAEVDEPQPMELDTVSRSPPPDAPSKSASTATNSETATVALANGISSKGRTQPKMPAGSDVAFYRDARVETVVESKATVRFIFTSELEEERVSPKAPQVELPAATVSSQGSTAVSSRATGEASNNSPWNLGLPLSQSARSEPEIATQNVHMAEQRPKTPPSQQSSSWMKSPRAFSSKESPSRAPDPEHLKAVWSQASAKTELPSINSLEGIADDLITVPFSLQDVKSEDGETPPPSGSGPSSRMSLHDVRRAFQQVPSSSASSASRGTSLPSVTSPTNSSTARQQPTFAFSPPMHGANLRPAYPSYPSPLLSHSPPMMYPHPMTASPVPRPMVAASPSYGQHVWVQVPGPQVPGGMMRPPTSPYPAQLLPYPSPGGPVPVYAPPPSSMQTPTSQQPNGIPARAHAMPMMSPIMQPTHSNHGMYAGSPVLMHAPPVPVMSVPANHGYHTTAGLQPHQGQARRTFENHSGVPVQHSQHPSYSTIPPNSFVRPNW